MSNDVTDVGLLVFDYHENQAADCCRIISNPENRLTLFTTEELADRISDDVASDIIVVAKRESESTGRYLGRISEICSSRLDLLYLFPLYGSPFDFFRYSTFDPACKMLLAIYNVNTWIGSNPCFTLRLDRYLTVPFRRRILSRVDAATVEYSPIRRVLRTSGALENVFSFTPVIHEGDAGTDQSERTKIAITGHITEKRKNYPFVLDAIAELPPMYKDSFQLLLLGKPQGRSGNRIRARCDGLRERGWDVEYFEDWIPISVFDRELSSSDAILCPLFERITATGFVEVYGKTKASGCVGDAIQRGVPIILPRSYHVPADLEPMVHRYGDGDALRAVLVDIIEGNDKRERSAAVDIASDYTLTEQQERFNSIVDAVLKD